MWSGLEVGPDPDDDFEAFAERHLVVKTTTEDLVPFRLRPVQRELHEAVTGRDIIDKARKEGISTYIAGRFYRDVTTRKNVNAAVVAHRPDATNELWRIVQTFYENDPRRLRTRYQSRKELDFADLGSRFSVLTAGEGSGRAATIHRLHVSELAHWKGDAKAILGGMIAAVPPGMGEIFIESTANGEGNEYHRRYLAAVLGEGEFTAHFFAWWQHAEYRRAWKRGAPDPSAAEREMMARFGLDLEQLAFWRTVVAEYGEDLAKQEYPATWQESFLSSGRGIFSRASLLALEALHGRKPEKLEREGDNQLAIYAAPRRGRTYVAGADTSEGVVGGDYQDVRVLDFRTLEEVAHLRGRWPIDVFARKLSALVTAYQAFTAIEVNNHGHAVMEHLLHGQDSLRIPRELLYHRRAYDQYGKAKRKPGWETSGKTKPILVADLEELIRRRQLPMHDATFYAEARAFAHLEDGSMGAPLGTHDDSVISTGLAIQARKRRLGEVGPSNTRLVAGV